MAATSSENLMDNFLCALSKFVPPPFPPPDEPIPSIIPQIPVKKDQISADENAPPRRSNSEPPPAPSSQLGRQSPKRRGDESPRSDTMSPARKVPKFAPPSPTAAGMSQLARKYADLCAQVIAPNPDPVIDEYFRFVAKTGRTLFPWHVIREAFLWKVEAVCQEVWKLCPFTESGASKASRVPSTENPCGEVYIRQILASAASFTGIPFTIQRLCELLVTPLLQYKRADKYFRALEKNLKVVTTIGTAGERVTREKSIEDHISLEESLENDLPNNVMDPDSVGEVSSTGEEKEQDLQNTHIPMVSSESSSSVPDYDDDDVTMNLSLEPLEDEESSPSSTDDIINGQEEIVVSIEHQPLPLPVVTEGDEQGPGTNEQNGE